MLHKFVFAALVLSASVAIGTALKHARHVHGVAMFAGLTDAPYSVTVHGPQWTFCKATAYTANGTSLDIQARECVADDIFASGFEP